MTLDLAIVFPNSIKVTSDLVIKLAGFLVVAVGGWRAICEYIRIGRWKAAELASAQIAALTDNDELAFACRALDWGVGPLIVPERYKAISPQAKFEHRIEMMERALEPELRMKANKRETDLNPQELIYRYAFDRLFDHFSQVNHMIERKLFRANDVSSMKCYLDLIVCYKYHKNKDRRKKLFVPFIKKYGYEGVLQLRQKIEDGANKSAIHKLLLRI